MDVIVLAAGYATRMYPLTEHFPKPLLPVRGRSILNRLLDDVAYLPGVSRLLVVTNHRFYPVFADWAAQQAYPLPVTVLDDGTLNNETRLGAVKDLLFVREATAASEDALVAAGDNLLDFSLAGFLEFYRSKRASAILCYEEPDPQRRSRSGVMVLDSTDRIVSFEEKPASPAGTLVAPPFYCFTKEDLDRLPAALADGAAFDAPGSFAAWLCRHSDVYGCRMPGRRYDVGSLKGYAAIDTLFPG